jgi:hypothetical protein
MLWRWHRQRRIPAGDEPVPRGGALLPGVGGDYALLSQVPSVNALLLLLLPPPLHGM